MTGSNLDICGTRLTCRFSCLAVTISETNAQVRNVVMFRVIGEFTLCDATLRSNSRRDDSFSMLYFMSNVVKGIFRDHSRDNPLNFHKIRDFCILVMVLDVCT